MALYYYVKKQETMKKKVVNYFSYISLAVGSLLLFWSLYPIISFELYTKLFIKNKVFSPLPRSSIATSLEEARSILGSYTFFSSNLRDFTQASLWFPTKPQGMYVNTKDIKEYYLSIPKLNITNARVVVGGDDLAKGLVHYLPESLPGERGKVNIFGHSSLPALYNVKDYKTIFTYLPSLEKGDRIYVKVGNVDYEYEVFAMYTVKPDQVSVLEPKMDAAYLSLYTCIPPGALWDRLVVEAKMTTPNLSSKTKCNTCW